MVSKGWIKKLLVEIKQWRSEGVIDPVQENKILARYSNRLEYNRLINTIVAMGSILVGLGILLFIASNWDKLSRPVKIAIIFSVISAFNLVGYYFRFIKKEYPALGEGFLLIGAFSFGAGIWLIAQMYQIHYNFSAGILFWILGILPVVYFFRSWMILALASVLSCFWLGSYNSYYFYRPAFGFFPLIAVIGALCYLRRQRFSLFVVIVGLAMWLGHFWILEHLKDKLFDTSVIVPHVLLVTIYASFGFVLYGLGVWHLRNDRFSVFSFLYKFLGVGFISFSTYSLSFAHHYDKKEYLTTVPAKILLLLVFLFSLIIYIFYKLYHTSTSKASTREVRLIMWLFSLQVISMALAFSWLPAISISYNIILLAQALIFMYLGFIKRNEGIFRFAIVIFFLDVLSRYFDIFWKMMPRSLLFILGGIILIFGAIFANTKRKQLENQMAGGA